MTAITKSASIQHQFAASYKEITPSFPTHANTYLIYEKVREQKNSQTSEKREIIRRKSRLKKKKEEERLQMLKGQGTGTIKKEAGEQKNLGKLKQLPTK